MKRLLKNEKGLTLIELLAVVVILGIIAAIAIPSIGGLIDNSKKDAHIANAQQIANAAKTYSAAENVTISVGSNIDEPITLEKLINAGYLDEIKDPNGDKYSSSATKCDIKNTGSGYEYYVTLASSTNTYIDGSTEVFSLKRGDVLLPGETKSNTTTP